MYETIFQLLTQHQNPPHSAQKRPLRALRLREIVILGVMEVIASTHFFGRFAGTVNTSYFEVIGEKPILWQNPRTALPDDTIAAQVESILSSGAAKSAASPQRSSFQRLYTSKINSAYRIKNPQKLNQLGVFLCFFRSIGKKSIMLISDNLLGGNWRLNYPLCNPN